MHDALSSRDVIGQAKGILMERHGITADAAFSVLSCVSQAENIKLADVARRFVETGGLPSVAGQEAAGATP
jgi:AmiR/NasT family two-component response regulator